MATDNSPIEKLISEIGSAFRGVEKPQITLRVARGADDNRWSELPQLRRRDDHYELWTEVPQQDIEAFYDVFPWLCSIGFRFYLPAFMIHSLQCSPRLLDEVWLTYAFGDDFIREADIAILDHPQIKAVFNFLTTVLECVKDDYNRDWWNHPWDPEWEDDAEKERVWKEFGRAFTLLKQHATR